MSKVLVITPACHFKSVGAAQRDIYAAINLLKKLGHQVVLFTLDSSNQDANILAAVGKKYNIVIRKYKPTINVVSRLFSILFSPALLDGGAIVFNKLVASQEFINFNKQWKPNFIFSFCSYSWPVFKFAKQNNIASVFRSHNFESSFFWESLSTGQKFNPLNWLRVLAKYRGEYLAVKYSTKVGTLPFEQMSKYKKWKQNGVEILTLLFLPPSLRQPNIHYHKKPIDLFYLGASYNIVFHRRGAELLINKIAPLVLKQAPGQFRFNICGSKLPLYLANKCQGDIIYRGYVPNLEVFLQGMDAGVFPVFTGKTMKGKVFEALARAFPMVITSNCLGGYNLQDGKEVLIADTVELFVQKILQLADVKVRINLANNARIFGQNNFSEKKIIFILSKLLSDK